MRRIVINMQNSLFCNAIADTLRRSGNELEPYTIDSPDKVVDECKWIAPYALLMEVTGYTPWLLAERMKIRDAVKAQNPDWKIVFIVDENAEKAIAKQVKQAKKDGLIDQFIYGSISASYLADIVDSLWKAVAAIEMNPKSFFCITENVHASPDRSAAGESGLITAEQIKLPKRRKF